jgi:flavodoxin
MKSLLVVFSYHHKNTEKIARIFAKVLDAPIKTPQQIDLNELHEYNLIGMGSGIYGAKNHQSLLDLADTLLPVTNKHAFLFSTSALTSENKAAKDHAMLRGKLQAKGYVIVADFQCKGFNTNSFMKWFGGMNKGRPNAEDLQKAEMFAKSLKQKIEPT